LISHFKCEWFKSLVWIAKFHLLYLLEFECFFLLFVQGSWTMCWVQHNCAHYYGKFKILQWFVCRSMGTTLDLNKLWAQIECLVNINFATLFKVSSCLKFIIGLTNINFYILDCIMHIKKKSLFLFSSFFWFYLGGCVVGSLWHGKKIIVKEYHQNHLLIFQIVCKIMAFFCHVIFYKRLLFFVHIILMNWSQYTNIVGDQQ